MKNLIKLTLKEDIGRGDLYSFLGDDKENKATVITKQDGVFAGAVCIKEMCEHQNLKFNLFFNDGDEIQKGDVVCELIGNSNTLLVTERALLNLIQHASGIATKTREFVKELEGTNTILLDTRKTHPGLRVLDKYAVRCGGGVNHRMGLDDCLMLKDTNLKTISNLKDFIKKARKLIPFTAKIEVECESLDEAIKAMQAGADIIMCDNMSPKKVKEIVKYRDENFNQILLEASGNITLQTARDYALTGVDALSTGATIHQSVWLDFSMKIL